MMCEEVVALLNMSRLLLLLARCNLAVSTMDIMHFIKVMVQLYLVSINRQVHIPL